MNNALDGILVVSIEQAVAAPYAASRLADAGARVIKIERPEGDFARGYDRTARNQSAYFVWLNRGKESIALNLKDDADREAFEKLLSIAVLVSSAVPRRHIDRQATDTRAAIAATLCSCVFPSFLSILFTYRWPPASCCFGRERRGARPR